MTRLHIFRSAVVDPFLSILTALAILTSASMSVSAQSSGEVPADILLLSDDVIYDGNGEIVTAKGNVEVSYNDYVLMADRLIYDRKAGRLKAIGNVTLLENTGNVVFADQVDLNETLTQGFVRKIVAQLSDKSRLAAAAAYRKSENVTELHKAVYSPCKICKDGSRPPVWQLKAFNVTRDMNSQQIKYEDAFLEFYGIPVLYTPYFAHPDPSVERKSGFLAPKFSSSSDLGTVVETPYYFVIDETQDLTLTPGVTSKEGPILSSLYRSRYDSGDLRFEGSITYPNERNDFGDRIGGHEVRGHVFGSGAFRLNDNWNWGFQVERASDDTYLNRYDISDADELTSKLYAEGFDDLSSASIEAYAFQGLRATDDDDTIPFITPSINYHLVSDPGVAGGRFFVDANTLVVSRTEGTDTRRLSLTGGWHLPFIGRDGGVYDLSASLRGDVYHIDNVPNPALPGGKTDGDFEYRLLPLIAFEYTYPLVKESGSVRQVLEPKVSLVYAGEANENNAIPNEDGGSFEFDDTNIFSTTRFPGLDQWEDGARASLGVKWAAYGQSGGHTSVSLGQIFRLEDEGTFSPASGLDGKRSDYVGRIEISPGPYLDFIHRFRIDKNDFNFNRNEVSLSTGPSWLRFNGGYIRLEKDANTLSPVTREEARLAGYYKMAEFWSLRAYGRRDLELGQAVDFGGGLFYQDECLYVGLTFKRSFTRDRDVKPTDRVGIQIKLLNLGGQESTGNGDLGFGDAFNFL